MELQDVLRVAGVGLIIALLHVFFDQVRKKGIFVLYILHCIPIHGCRTDTIFTALFW